MPKNKNQRLKLLYLKEILEEYTDADHGITMERILELMSMRGIKAERKSIYEDIDALINDLDMDIQRPSGRDFTYRLNSRLFDIAELKLIIDSVQSSKFLSEKSSRDIIKHLFLHRFDVLFDNNMSKRDLRECKKRQKMSGGFGVADGRNISCRILSFIESCKRRTLNVFRPSIRRSQRLSWLMGE